MAQVPVPITYGSGQASVAGDVAGGALYQQIKVVDGTIGGSTGLIVNADGTANVRISGSVATAGGTFTGSVSGTVGASIIGTVPVVQSGTVISSISGVVNVAGSVAAFQAGTQISSISGQVTVVSSLAGGIFPISGSVAATVTNFPTTQNVSGSVVATQGTSPWIITGSVQGSFAPSGNQSVSGTVGASIIGAPPFVISSVLVPIPVIGSFSPSGNQSVSGTVGASIIGNVPVVVQSSVAVAIISGSIAATFTPPANQSVSGTVQTDVRSSVAVVIIGGSIAASFTPPANQSVSGTVNIGTGGPISVLGTMSVLGTVPVTQATASNPWIITGSVQGSFSPAANQSVSGTVAVTQQGTWYTSVLIASVVGAIPVTIASVPPQSVSGTVGASIIGQLPAGTAVLGSVAALQGTSPWIETFSNSSILAVPVGSVITVFQAPSIVGTYAEDAASASGDKGFLVMGARNDTLSSVTSNDGDYSSHVVGPAGELISVNAPFTKWIQGNASVLGPTAFGPETPILAAQGASIFTYVTAIQVANVSANNVFVRLLGGSSTVGYTIAPANGGSNIVLPNAFKLPANGAFTASVSGVSSVYLSAQGFIAKI